MPIKHFEAYIAERKLASVLPLSTLSDTRLGIDAAFYLNQVLESPSGKEPFLSATGGVPLALASRVENDLRVLEKLRIKPVFVFPGLQPKKSARGPGSGSGGVSEYADEMREKREAWDLYERGQADAAERLFEGKPASAYAAGSQWELWRSVLRLFKNRNVEFLVAPYTAWAQLFYLLRHQKAYVNAIYASSDIFLYHTVDKIVTSIDFNVTAPTFNYISKRTVLTDIGLTEEQFLDMGILAGCDNSPTFPPLAASPDQTLKTTVDMIKHYKSGHTCVASFAEHPPVKIANYLDHFMRTRSMFKYSLILSSDGSVQPLPLAVPAPAPGTMSHTLTAADIPTDLHEIFTNRLPDEIYYYLSRGLTSPQPLIWLTSGVIIERPPLCGGETSDYRRFVKEVISEGATGPRATTLALISTVSHSFWTSRRIVLQLWFESNGPSKQIQYNQPTTNQAVERVAGWCVPSVVIEDELRLQNSSTIDFSLALGATSNDQSAARTRNKAKFLERKDEVVANVIWRFLELRGFLNNEHTHAPLARAMHSALKRARTNDKFQDPLFLLLELVRAGVLHWDLWGGRAYSGGPSFGSEHEKKCMLLIMRVLSIVPLNTKPKPWKAPLSRELLVFNSFLRSLSRSLRMLVETTAMNLLLRGDAARMRDDLLDISMALPFQTETNTGFGILAKVYLDALHALYDDRPVVSRDDEGLFEAKEQAMECVEETFEAVRSPRTEVERGFRFWDAALCAIRQMHADGQIQPQIADSFEAAQEWLEPRRP